MSEYLLNQRVRLLTFEGDEFFVHEGLPPQRHPVTSSDPVHYYDPPKTPHIFQTDVLTIIDKLAGKQVLHINRPGGITVMFAQAIHANGDWVFTDPGTRERGLSVPDVVRQYELYTHRYVDVLFTQEAFPAGASSGVHPVVPGARVYASNGETHGLVRTIAHQTYVELHTGENQPVEYAAWLDYFTERHPDQWPPGRFF